MWFGVTGRIMWDSWWTAQGILLSGKVDVTPVITHTFGLEDYDRAIQARESASGGKWCSRSSRPLKTAHLRGPILWMGTPPRVHIRHGWVTPPGIWPVLSGLTAGGFFGILLGE